MSMPSVPRSLCFSFLLLPVLVSAQTTVTTGGGTTNQVPKFTSGSQIGNSAITESNGNVGIGTTSPATKLEVNGTTQFDDAVNASGHDAFIATYATTDGSTPFKNINGNNYVQLGQMGSNGFGIGNWENSALLEGTTHLTLDSYSGNTYFQTRRNTVMALLENGNVGIGTTNPGAKLDVAGSVKISGTGASMTFPDNTLQSTAWNGTTCGGDYAESVDVTGDRTSYEPGDVLVIDPKHPGSFLKSVESYATSVTGIFSTKPGLTGRRQLNPKSDEEVPMAMMGIVPTKVSAENGPIHPGDLLVSSSRPGYAMKGTDRSKMLGAVIGKALGDLDRDTGVMEVVVTLQ